MPAFPAPTELELRFIEALALIVGACLFVPLFRRLGLGTVLGYLASGVAIGASLTLGIAEHPDELLHFAEFGVVLYLFVIGLELNFVRLWSMRSDIFGFGLVQVVVCGAALALPAVAAGFSVNVAVIIGLGLALSSTALVMQRLDETGERTSEHGRKAFAVLLFQDLAIVPLLLAVQVMAPAGADPTLLGAVVGAAIALAAIAVLVAVGEFLLDPMFRLLAQARMPEIMTAAALGVVIAAALAMKFVGMSYAMGAFIAGVMLAESSYRHEIEADIEPFRGLFLGLFFMAVGISLDIQSVVGHWQIVVGAVALFSAIKAAAIYAAARGFGIGHNSSVRIAFGLAQHGEFGFVLFAAAATAGLIDRETSSVLVAIVTGSMAAAPLIERLVPRLLRHGPRDTIDEDFSDAGGSVLIVGFGRFGQIFAQTLLARDVPMTILDSDPVRVREAARFGSRIHFGDGTRRDVLRAAGAGEAALIAVCIDRREAADRIVAIAQKEFPGARLFVRSYDRRHSIALVNRGVESAVRETFESSLRLGSMALAALGFDEETVTETIKDVRRRDRDRLMRQAREVMEDAAAANVIDIHPKPLRRRSWGGLIRASFAKGKRSAITRADDG